MACAQRLLPIVGVLVAIAVPLCGQSAPPAATSSLPQDQHFACNTGYTRATCHTQMQQLAAHLGQYRDELPSDWTWVLVRSQDWHGILLRLGRDPQSPAFTVLDQRSTFLSEALIAPDAYSGAALLRTFKVPLDGILDVAITHELGHAYCDDKREGEADHFGERLRTTGAAQCTLPRRTSTRDSISTMGAPR
jgi:hypothetical protein